MSAIAHFLEDEGIATSVIALIRLHVEKATPPRALWVPFQLGRPLGAPGAIDFQRDVIFSALKLLDLAEPPPILVDYPNDEPASEKVEDWSPSILSETTSLVDEVEQLQPFYRKAQSASGRTTVGISGLSIEAAVQFLLAYDSDKALPNPRKDLSSVQTMRYAVDDLKAFYLEALVANTEPASAWQFNNWFWEHTRAGELVKSLRLNSIGHVDENRRYAAWWLVPDAWSDRETINKMREATYQGK